VLKKPGSKIPELNTATVSAFKAFTNKNEFIFVILLV
jgi:hypothetical protein